MYSCWFLFFLVSDLRNMLQNCYSYSVVLLCIFFLPLISKAFQTLGWQRRPTVGEDKKFGQRTDLQAGEYYFLTTV